MAHLWGIVQEGFINTDLELWREVNGEIEELPIYDIVIETMKVGKLPKKSC